MGLNFLESFCVSGTRIRYYIEAFLRILVLFFIVKFARKHSVYLGLGFVIILRHFYEFATQGKLNAMHLIAIFFRNPDAQHYIYLSHEFVIILRTFYEFVAQGKMNAMHLIVILLETPDA